MEFPLELDADSIRIDRAPTGEWELLIELEDGNTLVHYTNMPDMLYDQLVKQGRVEVE